LSASQHFIPASESPLLKHRLEPTQRPPLIVFIGPPAKISPSQECLHIPSDNVINYTTGSVTVDIRCGKSSTLIMAVDTGASAVEHRCGAKCSRIVQYVSLHDKTCSLPAESALNSDFRLSIAITIPMVRAHGSVTLEAHASNQVPPSPPSDSNEVSQGRRTPQQIDT
jgi:hypothetical protein